MRLWRACGVIVPTGHLDNWKAAEPPKRMTTDIPIRKQTSPEMQSIRASQRLDAIRCTGKDGKTWAYIMEFRTYRPINATLATIAF